MRGIDQIYIDGQFVTPRGQELFDLYNPATEEKIGQVRLGDELDARAAIAAAKRAFPAFSRTGKAERVAMLRRLHEAVSVRAEALAAAMTREYGAPQYFLEFAARRAGSVFLDMAQTWRPSISPRPSGGRKSPYSRSAWSRRSRRGTATSASSATSSRPQSPPAALS